MKKLIAGSGYICSIYGMSAGTSVALTVNNSVDLFTHESTCCMRPLVNLDDIPRDELFRSLHGTEDHQFVALVGTHSAYMLELSYSVETKTFSVCGGRLDEMVTLELEPCETFGSLRWLIEDHCGVILGDNEKEVLKHAMRAAIVGVDFYWSAIKGVCFYVPKDKNGNYHVFTAVEECLPSLTGEY